MDRCAASCHPAVPSETGVSAFYLAMKHLIHSLGLNRVLSMTNYPSEVFDLLFRRDV